MGDNLLSSEKVWDIINSEFNLIRCHTLEKTISNIILSYEYLEALVKFSKYNVYITAISKIASLWEVREDLNECLSIYGYTIDFPLYYAEYKFLNNCKYGDEFRDVYLIFISKDEVFIQDLITRFQKLKAFT